MPGNSVSPINDHQMSKMRDDSCLGILDAREKKKKTPPFFGVVLVPMLQAGCQWHAQIHRAELEQPRSTSKTVEISILLCSPMPTMHAVCLSCFLLMRYDKTKYEHDVALFLVCWLAVTTDYLKNQAVAGTSAQLCDQETFKPSQCWQAYQ